MEENKLYCSYYTKSEYITDYMVKMLDFNKEHLVLEPSAGDGVFIDELLKREQTVNIAAYDLNPNAVKILKEKYQKLPNITVVNSDTLLDLELDMLVVNNGHYDRVIGNPPYGAWQDYDKRDKLKNIYKGYYVKETYTLFLLRCVSLLKENGRLTFIIPDTFMNLHMHNKLREYLLLNSKILEILMIPSSFFPGVNFGYSNLTIITVQKTTKEQALNNNIRIVRDLKKVSDIDDITQGVNLDKYSIDQISQREVYNSVDMAFLIKAGDQMRKLINNPPLTLGDIADCATGIYTGDNKRFFKAESNKVRNPSNCEIITKEEINNDYLEYDNLLDGIDDDRHFIPVVKGNSEMYVRKNEWYIDWGIEAVNLYKTVKKARFQNSQFYFKKGIAVPMVKSSKVKANLIDRMVFDQSVVGIFPRNEDHTYFLLALLNSDVVNTIIHTINHTANNSANYIKKIPVIMPSEPDIQRVNNLVQEMIDTIKRTGNIGKNIQYELNQFFNSLYVVEELVTI